MNILINLLLSTFAVLITAAILPGVHVSSFFTALIVAVVMGVVNSIIKPILFILTLPINLITLGLFTFIINGLLVLLVSSIVRGFVVDNILWAILFSIILSIVSSFISSLR